VRQVAIAGTRHVGEVSARAERVTCARHHDHSRRRAIARVVEGPQELIRHDRPDGVALLRMVERDGDDGAILLHADA
jgi:hypothetical protein